MKSVSGLLHNTLHSSWFITLSTWQTWIWMQVTHGLIKPLCIMEIKTPIHFACVFWVSVAARGIRFTDVHREMTLLPTQAWLDTNKAKWDSNMLLCCGQSLLSFCQVEARYSWLFQNVWFFLCANLDMEVFILLVPMLWPSKMIKCVCLLSTHSFNSFFLDILSFYSIIWKEAVWSCINGVLLCE